MSRRRSRPNRTETVRSLSRVREEFGELALVTARADLSWLAHHQRDVAAREASTGRALTGMPVHRSAEPRLPGELDGPDLSGDIARALDELVAVVRQAGVHLVETAETARWHEAAQALHGAYFDDARTWWGRASALRARAERVLGPDAYGRWLGPCPIRSCPGEVRLGDDQTATACPVCGTFVTREQQEAYLATTMVHRLMTVSELATALTIVTGRLVTYETVRTWTRTRNAPRGRRLPARLHERHDDGTPWRGIPWPTPDTGLYSFRDALDLVAQRETRVRIGSAAA